MRDAAQRGEDAIWIEIAATRGSTPRDAGTAMKVTANGSTGTIGGGALEYQAIAQARDMLARGTDRASRTMALGPGLGQCCGGAVTLHFGRREKPVDEGGNVVWLDHGHVSDRAQLWIWGAGHVGRAVIALCPPRAFRITWIDETVERFPASVFARDDRAATVMEPGLSALPAADMPLLASRAPTQAHHLIFTYSHEIDLALCAALLRRGAPHIGLIGSATKKARFWKRLRAAGLDPASITCPIGDPALGKAPIDIARGTIAALLAPAQPRKAIA